MALPSSASAEALEDGGSGAGWRWGYLGLALVLVVAAGLYVPMLSQWFNTDDFLFVNAGQDASPAGYIKDVFDFRSAPPLPEGRFYRPLHSTAFIVLYDAFGLHAWGYHLWSLVLHLTNTVFVWLICRRLTKNQLAAGLAAAFFALHPAHAGAVSWISNNNALMATCASLAALWCFMRATDSEHRRRIWYGASLVLYSASLLFHPEAGALVAALIAYRLLVQMKAWREALEWRRWLDLVPFAVVAGLYVAIQRWMESQGFLPQAEAFHISWHMLRVYFGYFAMSVYPTPVNQLALSSARHVVAAAALGLAIVLLLVTRTRQRPYVAAFAVSWYLVALLPLSTAVFAVDVAARKLYVAGPALAIMLALLVTPVVERAASWRSVALAKAGAALILLLALSLAAWQIVDQQRDARWAGDQSHAYVRQLQKAYPTIPEGSRLHVIGLPWHLAILSTFYDDYVISLVGMYYQGIDVVVERGEMSDPLGPHDVVFRYGS